MGEILAASWFHLLHLHTHPYSQLTERRTIQALCSPVEVKNDSTGSTDPTPKGRRQCLVILGLSYPRRSDAFCSQEIMYRGTDQDQTVGRYDACAPAAK